VSTVSLQNTISDFASLNPGYAADVGPLRMSGVKKLDYAGCFTD
jgi:hypothetical protein